MPVTVLQADLFDLGAQTIVNPVNTVGVMGKGLALEFARRFPAHLDWYRAQCQNGSLDIGRPQLDRGQQPWILAFATKRDWRAPSQMSFVEAGLASLVQRLPGSGIESLAMPALGCGLGGLPWPQVRDTVCQALAQVEIPVWLIKPGR
jgi:O-acetyl-ADP-ribose deacetylase (regulator of RNase III)